MKKIGKSKVVYRFEKLDSKDPKDSTLDAGFEITDISKSNITILGCIWEAIKKNAQRAF